MFPEGPAVADDERLRTARGVFAARVQGPADAPVVLCQHGFPDDASTFDSLGEALARAGYRVVAPNLRGYAPSPLQGSLGMRSLVADLMAIIDLVSPDEAVAMVGHDFGAQLAYPAMAAHAPRFASAVLMAGAHPAHVIRNARLSPRQWWRSRYIVFFQLGRVADRAFARDDFAYVDRLWRRWSAPGATLPAEHLAHVKRTLRASMPAPVAMYRAEGFAVPKTTIFVPTLYLSGRDDGCAAPRLAQGQEALFPHGYRAETWPGTGHFLHLEQPDRTATAVLSWLTSHYPPRRRQPVPGRTKP
ncbi:alpha/beta fold hydrolase [Ornithinimicrobium sp. LYQ121]|uniref:alpha/beta fold hydrolase n=1 Tax=Ornithinimicrobium sp. LYQ121 TaxID=3378801 RepID=UPI00385377F7